MNETTKRFKVTVRETVTTYRETIIEAHDDDEAGALAENTDAHVWETIHRRSDAITETEVEELP